MLGRVANKIPTFEIKGKNVIEFYPGFGLLSTRCAFNLITSTLLNIWWHNQTAFEIAFFRILKKEPLSYTFVEPDKRVVQSLGRLAQAAEDNGIGSRIIRAEPLEYDFHKLHFSKARRSMVSSRTFKHKIQFWYFRFQIRNHWYLLMQIKLTQWLLQMFLVGVIRLLHLSWRMI